MDANHFLSAYYPDTSYGGKRLFDDMVEQAKAAERLGYHGVTLPEHHLINVLLTPSPLQMAVKLACDTERLELVTSVAVLPLRDMRIFAGEVIQADILTDGRLVLGVGRGAFAYEMGRLGSPIEESKARFDESLDVLIALMTTEEVSWDGDYYQFEPLTVMPRPMTQPMPRMMIAVMNPPGIAASTRRGFDIQTTPLAGRPELFRAQIAAHKEAKAEMGDAGRHLRIMMSRIVYCTDREAQTREMGHRGHDYYSRFDNVFQSIGTLFEMSTTEGWADVMWQGVDSRGIEMQPVRDNQPGWVWFFMFFMVVGSFFAVNLFVGVVIDNFNQMKAKQGGSILQHHGVHGNQLGNGLEAFQLLLPERFRPGITEPGQVRGDAQSGAGRKSGAL